MHGVGDALPAVYTERLRTEVYDERVVHPGAWNKIVVVANENDDEYPQPRADPEAEDAT
jgi:hypothetical protein